MASVASKSGDPVADGITLVTRNACQWCGIEAEVMPDVPFPHVRWFDWRPFTTKCLTSATWRWCSNRRQYAGTLERRR